ncbi:unnamed protein product [Rangifer tarandus platyrhynchus]
MEATHRPIPAEGSEPPGAAEGGCLATAELFRRESFQRRSPSASHSSLSARGSGDRDAPGPKALRASFPARTSTGAAERRSKPHAMAKP